MSIHSFNTHIHPHFSQRLKCLPHFSCFPFLHCLLIDSSCHSPQISDSSPPLLGPRHSSFHFSTTIPPWHLLSCPTGWTKNFPFCISFHFFSNHCIFSSTCATLHPLCSSAFCFSVSPILCFFAFSTPHSTPLLFTQELLPLVLLCFCPL